MVGRRPERDIAAELADQAGQFPRRQVTPTPGLQVSQVNIHDSHALQPLCFVSQGRAHAANLPIQSLGENDAKGLRIDAAGSVDDSAEGLEMTNERARNGSGSSPRNRPSDRVSSGAQQHCRA